MSISAPFNINQVGVSKAIISAVKATDMAIVSNVRNGIAVNFFIQLKSLPHL